MIIPNIWENKTKCSKPPTSNHLIDMGVSINWGSPKAGWGKFQGKTEHQKDENWGLALFLGNPYLELTSKT